jgi:hypothetical protein
METVVRLVGMPAVVEVRINSASLRELSSARSAHGFPRFEEFSVQVAEAVVMAATTDMGAVIATVVR